MKNRALSRSRQRIQRVSFALATLAVLVCQTVTHGQSPPTNRTAEQDHQNMMDQLGITTLRAGPSGNEKDSNRANYNEGNANPYSDLPDALTLKSGQKVTSAEQWWNQRRPGIVEDFEREVVGRIPPNVPRVAWTRLPGLAERRSSENVGMATSTNEITKMVIPNAFSDEWLCL
jgi:hypothetical protein